MAIVEKSTKSNPKQWEEFAVLRLSRRELAGIAALIADDASDLTKFKLYDDIANLLGGKNNYYGPIGNRHEEARRLDNLYGGI